jgi:hypothetical protein
MSCNILDRQTGRETGSLGERKRGRKGNTENRRPHTLVA